MTQQYTLKGLGFYVPKKIISNQDLERIIDTTDEWITSRTGIKTRHFVEPGTATSDLALEASKKALTDAGMSASDLTHIIVPTFTPDSYIPSAACLLQHKLGIHGIPSFDLSAACSGFLFGLENARALIALHPEAKVLIAASEVISSRTNFKDRTTCVLFGDGAGAAIIGAGDNDLSHGQIIDILLESDGSLGKLLTVKGGGSYTPPVLDAKIGPEYFVQMEGREVFKHAVRSMTRVCKNILAKNNLFAKDIDLIIPHQANIRIIQALAKKLDVSLDRVFINVDRYGNTSAASVPIALAEAKEEGRLVPGAKVLLTSFGGGFTWASTLLQF